MPISGVVIACLSEKAGEIGRSMASIEGVDLHHVGGDSGKIVAVLEADDVEAEIGLVSRIQALPGVIDVQVAYHNFEDLQA